MDARTAIMDCASKLVALTKKRDYGEAVRLFKEVSEKLPSLTPDRVAVEVGHLSGEPALRALVKSFAFAPCYWCKEGYMTCELCDGADTIASNGRYCEECGGYGHTLCTFCGGSGFLFFDQVPSSLVEAVVSERLKWGASSLRRVARHSSKLKRLVVQEAMSTGLFDVFHTTLRIGAVLDNVKPVVEAGDEAGAQAAQRSRLAKVANDCRQVNTKYRTGLAKAIVEYCRARANSEPPGSEQRTTWERRTDFYSTLAPEKPAD
jgi:hypothetical protein